MILQRFRKCEGCYKPINEKFGDLQSKDDYECYGEGYVKCFWGLCDQQKTAEAFALNSNASVVTRQPRRQVLTYSHPALSKTH